MGRRFAPLELDEVERTELASLATRRSTAQGLAQRARIIALGLDPRVGTGFPSGQTRSVCPEMMLKQKDQIIDPIQFNRIMVLGACTHKTRDVGLWG